MTEPFILTDGHFYKNDEKIFTSGIPGQILFTEKIRSVRNRLMFWEEQVELIRIQLGLLNEECSAVTGNKGEELRRQTERALVKNKLYRDALVHISFFKNGDKVSYLIRTEKTGPDEYELNDSGLLLDLSPAIYKSRSSLSSLRIGSEPFWRILTSGKSSVLNETILQNQEGCLLEAPERNLFLIRGNEIITAAPETGIYISPARSTICQICHDLQLSFTEKQFLPEEMLLLADEVFLAGAVHGIQWALGFEKKRYLSKTVRIIHEDFIKKTVKRDYPGKPGQFSFILSK